MISESNTVQSFANQINLNQAADDYKMFKVPTYILQKVPRHW